MMSLCIHVRCSLCLSICFELCNIKLSFKFLQAEIYRQFLVLHSYMYVMYVCYIAVGLVMDAYYGNMGYSLGYRFRMDAV